MSAITVKRIKVKDNKIISTMKIGEYIFHVHSIFDNRIKLIDLLLSAANENIIKKCVSANDRTKRKIYNFGEENSHIDA